MNQIEFWMDYARTGFLFPEIKANLFLNAGIKLCANKGKLSDLNLFRHGIEEIILNAERIKQLEENLRKEK